jgi:hypothetical protein
MVRCLIGVLLCLAACGEEPPFPEDYQTSWQEVLPCAETSQHGGDSIRIFINSAAEPTWNDWAQRVLDSGNGILPAGETIEFSSGAVLLKAQYSNSNCSQFKHWTMMTRLETGADTANGNWRWEIVTADEEGVPKTPTAGGDGCFSCHQSYRRTDYAGNSPNPPQVP